MDALRISLIIIGAVIVLAIYVAGRYRRRQRDESLLAEEARDIDDAELEGLVGLRASSDDESIVGTDVGPMRMDDVGSQAESLLVALNILSPTADGFAGTSVRGALEQRGFVFGDMNIFHLYPQPGQTQGIAVCSVANVLKPGTFDLATIDDDHIRGLSIFMQLPGALEGREAFERTLEAARGLATDLGGELCDESRSVLTAQTVSHLKEKIEAYQLRAQMARVRERGQH